MGNEKDKAYKIINELQLTVCEMCGRLVNELGVDRNVVDKYFDKCTDCILKLTVEIGGTDGLLALMSMALENARKNIKEG